MMVFTGDFFIVMIIMLSLIGKSINGENGEEYEGVGGGAPMVKTEQEALYSAIQGFVGEWWNGSDLYPDPCGWTRIQVPHLSLYKLSYLTHFCCFCNKL